MDLNEFKMMLIQADKETDLAHQDYSKKSAAHKLLK